jgi:uncharacterized protein
VARDSGKLSARWRRELLHAFGGIVLAMGVLSAIQGRFLFFPARDLVASPADVGLDYQSVRMATADGVAIHGWWLPAGDDAPATVLFLHGNAGNISYWLEAVVGYREAGWNVLLIDYRGYGLSEGAPTEEGTYLDADAAWKHLTETRGIAPSRIVVIGRSLGGGVALGLLQNRKPGALVLEATFTSLADMASRVLPIPGIGAIMRIHYPNLDRIRSISVPVLVVHSKQDDLVPYEHGRALFEAAPEPKRFLEIRSGHNDGFVVSRHDYIHALKAFVAEVVR